MGAEDEMLYARDRNSILTCTFARFNGDTSKCYNQDSKPEIITNIQHFDVPVVQAWFKTLSGSNSN
eukprot:Nk52_evm31s2039 gene=Nk52_evmTU31s2039